MACVIHKGGGLQFLLDKACPILEKSDRVSPTRMTSSLDIHTSYFGLTERPFSLVPDSGFLYWSPAHKRAQGILEYGILTRAPITLITGAGT